MCYARTTVRRARAGSLRLAWRLDYFGKLWVNGRLVQVVNGGHGNVNLPLFIPVDLRAGDNSILVRVHSGSRGNRFSLYLEELE